MTKILSMILKICFLPFRILLGLAIKKSVASAYSTSNDINIVNMVDDPKGRKLTMTTEVAKDQELDFLKYRSKSYLTPMTSGVAEELALMILGKNKVKPINLEVIGQMFLSSAGALLTSYNKNEDVFEVRFTAMKAPFWESYPKDIEWFKFNPTKDFYQIKDCFGQTYSPGDENWETALYHLVYLYSISVPMGSHNWVHFSFPDSFAAGVFKKINKSGILYKLIYPHTRFTNRINYQAVWIQKSTDNSTKLGDTLTPWKCFPIDAIRFREGVLENTYNHYEHSETHLKLTDNFDTSIPYFKFLKAYFDVIEDFVIEVAPYMNQDDYKILEAHMMECIPSYQKGQMIRYLALLIWQGSVLHTTEHLSYYNIAMDYGFSKITKPITEKFTIDDISRYNRYKFRCFQRVFVKFNPTSKLDQKLTNYKSYNFEAGSDLEQIAKNFSDRLKSLDSSLREKGEAIVKLDEMAQSVCF